MGRMNWMRGSLWVCGLTIILLADPGTAAGQGSDAATSVPLSAQGANPATVGQILQQLQSQVQMLTSQVESLRQQQQSAQAESAELRKELDATKSRLLALDGKSESNDPPQSNGDVAGQQSAIEARVARLEESQQVTDQRMAEQNQTKVESSSKYRVRLSGIVLLNMYENRGSVDNQDFPELATAPSPLSSGGSFGGSLRQSQIGLQGFGPTVGGAQTSAEVQFDFAGGFPTAPNGVSFGLMRLRTGTVRFDWGDTSIIAGQDALFFAPLSPTSIATLAIPAFAYSGNLWSWTPQVRVEHRFTVSDNSSLLLQGGLLDPLAGDKPPYQFYRYPGAGENSGQPAYATRIAWTQSVGGQKIVAGVGGYYSRQDWGYGRTVDAWAGTADVTVPLGSKFEFTGQFFRGRGIGGLGGGIGQTALWNEEFTNPTTEIYGLDSIGGWAQLKYKATAKLQFNGAFGMDNPYAGDLRQFGGNQTYFSSSLSKNQTVMGNFLYQPKSDIVLSLEYRRLNTYTLDSTANRGNIITTSVGYIF
jgi:outer membrane murein-binding lipoprotein Lpp